MGNVGVHAPLAAEHVADIGAVGIAAQQALEERVAAVGEADGVEQRGADG